MTISPLLQNRIGNDKKQLPNNAANYEQIYNDLASRANEIKPNQPKARLVKQTPVTSLKDTANDCANFAKAVKTGKMNDNSLGRINDVGLKLGGLLIATFLAAHSKTKTEAAMKYIGVGGFFAAMNLYPKIFYNLPARIVHGFNIGDKYISAQGEKKDVRLDNQYMPNGIYSDEYLAKVAKRNKIDFNEDNGKEKIERKMQKVSLQNRTLAMLFAGFATPVLTALFCDKVEPHVKDAITNHDYKKVQKSAQKEGGIQNVIKNAEKEIRNEKAIETLFETKQPTDEGFFKELAELLRFDNFKEIFSSKDDIRPIERYKAYNENVENALKELFANTATVSIKGKEDDIIKTLKENIPGEFDFFTGETKELTDEAAQEILNTIKQNPTLANLRQTLTNHNIKREAIDTLTSKLPVDSSAFAASVKDFNLTAIAQQRGSLMKFVKSINPVIGQRMESKSTQGITNSLQFFFKKFNPDTKTLKSMKEGTLENTSEIVQGFYQSLVKDVKFGSEEYSQLINELLTGQSPKITKENSSSKAKDFLNGIIQKITPDKKEEEKDFFSLIEEFKKAIPSIRHDSQDSNLKALNNALFGTDDASLIESLLPKYIQEQLTNTQGFTSRAAICANFETRLKEGKIQIYGQDLKDNPELLKAARKLIYEGNQSFLENDFDIKASDCDQVAADLLSTIFNKEAFENEPDKVKQAAQKLLEQADYLRKPKGKRKEPLDKRTENYLLNLNYASQIKEKATNLFNNKSWKKYFIPLALVVTITPLIAQPFFGNIKKEYPEKQGGKK